jgi:hypothetical protein
VRRLALLLLLCTSCGTATSDPQLPPTGKAAMGQWLVDQPYTDWSCEPAPHPSRNGSPHGNNRICSNAKLAGSTSPLYPAGAATVKELLNADGSVAGHSVLRKLEDGAGGSTWYFFEQFEGKNYADGADSLACSGCHARAGTGGLPGKDFVFVQVD